MQVKSDSPTWISGPKLRKRWDMPNSTFYYRKKKGQIPEPEYPFGPDKPFWRMSAVEAVERRSEQAVAA